MDIEIAEVHWKAGSQANRFVRTLYSNVTHRTVTKHQADKR